MEKYLDIFINGYTGYFNYLKNDILNPSWNSYFYWLILVSVGFLILEVVLPWRKGQPVNRKDFFLDGFYMFFNFFIFNLIIYIAVSDVIVNLFNDGILRITGYNLKQINPLYSQPFWVVLLVAFVFRDFIQWWVHRLLHKSKRLWEFHKVHHSVEEMGFAAHLRFHWMERVVYSSLEYLPLALIGIGLYDFFVIHIFALSWGHFNHANITVDGKVTGGILGALIGIVLANNLLDTHIIVDPTLIEKLGMVVAASAIGAFVLGPIMRKLFNSPEMHIWHHAYELPKDRQTGVNFGLTLALWDYIFGTAYIPHDGRDIRLGFSGIEKFPTDFVGHNTHGFVNEVKQFDIDNIPKR